jgi:hypothetical protein
MRILGWDGRREEEKEKEIEQKKINILIEYK